MVKSPTESDERPPGPRPYKRERRDAASEQTRSRIVQAAGDMLAAPEGMEGFSLDAVARRAGVARMTVYYQFKSRRGLLEAVFDDRAERGGLARLPAAFADADPRRGIDRVIEIFRDFWAADPAAMARLRGAVSGDPEAEESLRARDERRRQGLGVLVGRLVERGEVDQAAAGDLIDVLHTLTGHGVFGDLTATGRSAEAAGLLIGRMAADALVRAAPP